MAGSMLGKVSKNNVTDWVAGFANFYGIVKKKKRKFDSPKKYCGYFKQNHEKQKTDWMIDSDMCLPISQNLLNLESQ